MAVPKMRLSDLHCDWLRQYATETTLFDPVLYPEVPQRLGRLDGYLQGTSLAVLSCKRKPEDWAHHSDRWASLAALLSAYEAEFAGRLLIAPDDVERWRAGPADGLCWGTLGVAGFDFLIREPDDLERLPGLFQRGVRVFQLAASAANLLAGTAEPGDDRGLTDLGRACLQRLGELETVTAGGPTPVVDLAGLNCRSIAGVLEWCEQPRSHGGRPVLIMFSHGGVRHLNSAPHGALSRDHLVRLRMLGGVVGLTPGLAWYQTNEDLRAAIEEIASTPFEGRAGYEGIAIGTDFFGCEHVLSDLADVTRIARWFQQVFAPDAARLLLTDNASRLLTRAAGRMEGARPGD